MCGIKWNILTDPSAYFSKHIFKNIYCYSDNKSNNKFIKYYHTVVIWMRNFPHSLMHLNTDSQLMMLFGRVSEVWPGWRNYITVGGLWELIVLLHSQFSLCSSCLWIKMWTLGFLLLYLCCSLLPFLPTMMDSSSSGTVRPSKVFSKLLLVMCLSQQQNRN